MKKQVLMTFLFSAMATTHASLEISVATDKSVYQVGEAVTISVTAYNSSETETLNLSFGTAKQATYLLDSIFDLSSIMQYAQIPSGVHVDPLASYTWTFTHADNAAIAYPLTSGTHSVIGEIVGYGQSDSVEFEVVPEPITFSLLGIGFLLLCRNKNSNLFS